MTAPDQDTPNPDAAGETVHPAPAGDPQAALAAARAALDAMPGLTWRPWERDDLPGVLAMYEAATAADEGHERESLVGLQEYWDADRSRPERDTLAAWDASGACVATARAGCNDAVTQQRGVYVGGAVHPDHRGRGLGRAVLAWQLAAARAWDAATRRPGYGPLTLRAFPDGGPAAEATRRLLTRGGLAPARYSFEMSRPTDDLPEPIAPDGVDILPWDPARSADVHAVFDAAFADHWGTAPRTEQMWQEQMTSADTRFAWSRIAVADGEVVGALLGAAYEQDWDAQGFAEGYADELGVLRSHRGRGIASALLVAHMHACRADGLPAVGLGVDAANPSGALRLYEGLGYRRTSTTITFQRLELPA